MPSELPISEPPEFLLQNLSRFRVKAVFIASPIERPDFAIASLDYIHEWRVSFPIFYDRFNLPELVSRTVNADYVGIVSLTDWHIQEDDDKFLSDECFLYFMTERNTRVPNFQDVPLYPQFHLSLARYNP